MMDCNLKLIRRNVLLPSALATEAYQLPFNPSGSSLFGGALLALLEKAGEVVTQKRHQSLEEAMVKSAKGAKGPKGFVKTTSKNRSTDRTVSGTRSPAPSRAVSRAERRFKFHARCGEDW